MKDPTEVRMTFAEHLEELRSRLLISVGVFLVCVLVAMVPSAQDVLMRFLLQPFLTARERIAAARPPHPSPEMIALLDLVDHLAEKKVLEPPYQEQLHRRVDDLSRDPGIALTAIGVTESFMVHMKASLLAAALAASPVLLVQLWKFIAAGLFAHERRLVMRVLPLSLGLFAVGMIFGFLVLMPLTLRFLLSYGDPELVRQDTIISSYFALLFLFLFVMGLVFQIPLILTTVSAVGILRAEQLRSKRKAVMLGAFVVAAVVTPGDWVSMTAMAVPMILLFELGLIMAGMAERRRAATSKGAAA